MIASLIGTHLVCSRRVCTTKLVGIVERLAGSHLHGFYQEALPPTHLYKVCCLA
jgi:hypothetical protein